MAMVNDHHTDLILIGQSSRVGTGTPAHIQIAARRGRRQKLSQPRLVRGVERLSIEHIKNPDPVLRTVLAIHIDEPCTWRGFCAAAPITGSSLLGQPTNRAITDT